MAQATEALNFDQALDVERHFFAEIAFNAAFLLDDLADLVQLILIQRRELDERVNARLGQDRQRTGVPDALDIGKGDASLLISRQVDAGNTSHKATFRWGLHERIVKRG